MPKFETKRSLKQSNRKGAKDAEEKHIRVFVRFLCDR